MSYDEEAEHEQMVRELFDGANEPWEKFQYRRMDHVGYLLYVLIGRVRALEADVKRLKGEG